jgi:hypothetical protein
MPLRSAANANNAMFNFKWTSVRNPF